MLSAVLDALRFRWRERPNLKRTFNSDSDDCSSDDDVVLTDDQPKSAKKARINDGDHSQHGSPHDSSDTPPMMSRFAAWIAKSKRSFTDQYFVNKITIQETTAATVSSDEINMAESNHLASQSTSSKEWTRRQPLFPPPSSSSSAKSASKRTPRAKRLDKKSPKTTGRVPQQSPHRSNIIKSTVNVSVAGKLRDHWSQSKMLQPSVQISRLSSSSVHEKLFNGSSATQKSRNSSVRNFAVYDNIRLDERDRYQSLLQQFTAVQLDSPQIVNGSVRNENMWTRKRGTARQMNFGESDIRDQQRPPIKRYIPSGSYSLPSSTSVSPKLETVFSRDVRPRTAAAVSTERYPFIPTTRMALRSTSKEASRLVRPPPILSLDDDDDDDDEIVQVSVGSAKPVTPNRISCAEKQFSLRLTRCQYLDREWLPNLKTQYQSEDENQRKRIAAYEEKLETIEKSKNAELEKRLGETLRFEEIQIVGDEDEAEAEKKIEALPILSSVMLDRIEQALVSTPSNEILAEAFNLTIRRKDMETLGNVNWLNDEVINFYFNMLMERGKQGNFPSVHVCNTFFYTKLMSGGHTALKRWTRRVDVFAHEMMLVPVHLGVHWCLAVVDFKNKAVSYYDSMGGSNKACLQGLLTYLKAEHKEKKGSELDTSGWEQVNVRDNPRQLNGSDCGMFTCKYAEYISRRAKITFTQADMPYFRKRMVYEILTKRLL